MVIWLRYRPSSFAFGSTERLIGTEKTLSTFKSGPQRGKRIKALDTFVPNPNPAGYSSSSLTGCGSISYKDGCHCSRPLRGCGSDSYNFGGCR